MEWLYLLLAVAVVAFGVAVLVVSRRRGADTSTTTRPAPAPPTEPPRTTTGTDVLEPDVLEPDVLEPDVLEPDVLEPPVVEPPVVEPERASLRDRMAKARAALAGAFAGVRGRATIDAETWDHLEEALLRADVGVGVTDALLDDLRSRVSSGEITEPGALLDALRADMVERLAVSDRTLTFDPDVDGPNIWMFVGVNGVGKTTTIGKVGKQQADDGRSVLLAAGDTFRAAAAEQLATWAERAGADFVRGAEGSDPSSVIFDGVQRAASRDVDLVLADTAGRLHTKTNLMDELRKVRRVAEKGAGRVTETLLVIDATTGQNGLVQAREFGEATQVTGVVLTKLDGSAKGGIVFAVETELGIPVKLVGIGEQVGDLVPFDPNEFVDALFES